MDQTILKNGAEVPPHAVSAILITLRDLWTTNPVAAFELVALCRDPQHQLFGNAGTILRRLALLESDGQPHDVTRDVVLSAVQGDGFDMTLGSPYQEGGQEA